MRGFSLFTKNNTTEMDKQLTGWSLSIVSSVRGEDMVTDRVWLPALPLEDTSVAVETESGAEPEPDEVEEEPDSPEVEEAADDEDVPEDVEEEPW